MAEVTAPVLEFLEKNPGTWHTITIIHKAVGTPSRGAVDAACRRLAADGLISKAPWDDPKAMAFGYGMPAPAGGGPVTAGASGSKRGGGAGTEISRMITRPNGQPYHVRQLVGRDDVDVLRQMRGAGISILLSGWPGTGKTAVVEAAFGDHGLITIAGDGDTAVADFIGTWTVDPGGGYRWIDGPLPLAMRGDGEHGLPLLIDDATVIPPKVLAVLYPVMDGRGELVIKEHPDPVTGMPTIVKANPGFYPIAAHNPGTHGAVLSDALSSRFSMQIQVQTDYALALTLKVPPLAVKVARNLATQRDKEAIGWAPEMRELIAFRNLAVLIGETGAAQNLIGVAPEDDRDVVIETVKSVYGKELSAISLAGGGV